MLLICYATTNKQLRTVRASISWNQPKSDKIPPASLPVQPTIKTKHLAVTSWAHDINSNAVNASNMEASMVQLSHLEILPPCSDARGKILPPTIVAIRSHLPASSSHYNQDVHTTVDRWEVHEKLQSVHPAFEQLSSRRNSIVSQPGVSDAAVRIPLSY
jgi:mediator of RNA polymerase II transcription subunit 16